MSNIFNGIITMNKIYQNLFGIYKSLLQPSAIALLLLVGFSFNTQVQADTPLGSIEVIAQNKAKENVLTTFSALAFDRRVRNSTDGYSPTTQLPVLWTEQPKMRWDFGDGTAVVTVDGALNVGHTYRKQGSYTLTVTMSDSGGIYASGTREVVVANKEPQALRLAAAKGEKAGAIAFTASAQDAPEDELTFIWDFGDGTTREGIDLWQVQHQYLVEGTYDVKLKVVDDDGASESEDTKVKVSGGNDTADTGWQARAEGVALEDIIHGMNATITGGLNATMKAELHPLAGLLLSKVKNGDCRLVFSSWSNSQLIYGMFILDFPVIPPGGAIYQFKNPQVGLMLLPDQSAYLRQKNARAPRSTASDISQSEPVADQSPFGVDGSVGYSVRSGSAEIEFVPREYVKGQYHVVLKKSNKDVNPISFDADFAFDLKNSGGFANYEGCDEAPPLKIKARFPEIDTQHLFTQRPNIRVRFDQDVDPDSVTNTTFELVYPDANGKFIPVAGRILRETDTFFLVPNEHLKSGVRYTIRLKGGEYGIKGINGAMLDEVDNDEWHSWEFTSKIDFNTQSNGDQLLSCHIYQTVRDAPLIVGKPAIVRVDADWSELPDVASGAQIKEFEARVVLFDAQNSEVATEWHKFVRPDLWQKNGIDIKAAKQSALLTIPSVDKDLAGLRVNVQVRSLPNEEPSVAYYSNCPLKLWDKKPTLTVDLFALRTDEWFEDAAYQAMLPVIGQLAKEIEDYTWQLFPLLEVKVSSQLQSAAPVNTAGLISFAKDVTGYITDKQAADEYLLNVINGLEGRSSADIIILLVPHNLFDGGSTFQRLDQGQGIIYSLIGADPENFSRYVFAAVHEIGHSLTLPHLPYVKTDEERTLVIEKVVGGGAIWFAGIEGMRMSRDGADTWLKSSVSGNQESSSIVPLMFPKTRPTADAFMTHHEYRLLQKFFESR